MRISRASGPQDLGHPNRATPPLLLPRHSSPHSQNHSGAFEKCFGPQAHFALVEVPRSSLVWSSQQQARSRVSTSWFPTGALQWPQPPAAQASRHMASRGTDPTGTGPTNTSLRATYLSTQTPGPQGRSPQCLGLQAQGAQGAARPSTTIHTQPVVVHLQRQQDSLQL